MSIVQVGHSTQRRSDRWARDRKQQGSGVNRAELVLGNLTPEQCDKAHRLVIANAKDPEDAALLLAVLGLLPHDDDV